MRFLRLFRLFVRTELQFAMEYRVNLMLNLFEEVVVGGSSLIAVLVLFGHTAIINGWTEAQMIVLLGVFYLIQGLSGVLFETSFERFMEHVRLGTLDFILIKPVNSQFMVSARHPQLATLGQVALGVVLVGAGLRQAGSTLGVADVVEFSLALGCGLCLVYCLILVLSTLAFWFVRVENLLAIFWSFIDAGRFPVDIYPGWLRITLSTVVPIGIAVTVPAQAITGRLDAVGALSMLLGTVVVWMFATWFWRLGLRNYTGASA
jgi:ABC-2 type transport system permease protein